LRLPWKNRVVLKIFTLLNIILTFRFVTTCACPETQKVPWIQSPEYTFFTIQDFWTICACPEKQSCPGIFHCMEYTYYIKNFWTTCACPEKHSHPGIFHCIEYVFFIIQDFWATCAFPEKQSRPESFHCIEYSAVARQPRTPRSGGAPTIRRGPTIYIVLVSYSPLSTLDFDSSGFYPQCRAGRLRM